MGLKAQGREGGGLGRLVFSQDYLGRKTRFSSTVTNYVTKLDSLGIDEEPLHLQEMPVRVRGWADRLLQLSWLSHGLGSHHI